MIQKHIINYTQEIRYNKNIEMKMTLITEENKKQISEFLKAKFLDFCL